MAFSAAPAAELGRSAAGGVRLDPISINGEWPALVGQTCEELLATELWRDGRLVEPANVVYLRFGVRRTPCVGMDDVHP